MTTKFGIMSVLAGLFVGVFSGISKFMEADNFWVGLTISRILGEEKSDAVIQAIDVAVIQNSLDFLIYEAPFFLFLIGLGVFFLIISLFIKNH